MELMSSLGKSFHFAKKFNMDNDLRMALFKFGKMLYEIWYWILELTLYIYI
jgi:hypothetical protein